MSNNTDKTTDTITVTTTTDASLDFSLDSVLDNIFVDDDTSNYYTTNTMCDIDLTNLGDTITVSANDNLTFNTQAMPASIRIGEVELDETALKKLKALVDMLEGLDDDNELKQMFNTQQSLNEISK